MKLEKFGQDLAELGWDDSLSEQQNKEEFNPEEIAHKLEMLCQKHGKDWKTYQDRLKRRIMGNTLLCCYFEPLSCFKGKVCQDGECCSDAHSWSEYYDFSDLRVCRDVEKYMQWLNKKIDFIE